MKILNKHNIHQDIGHKHQFLQTFAQKLVHPTKNRINVLEIVEDHMRSQAPKLSPLEKH